MPVAYVEDELPSFVSARVQIMDECIIRHSTRSDMPAVTAIYAYFVETCTATFDITAPDCAEMCRRRDAVLEQRLPYLVAELKGYTVGFCYASQYRPREGYRFTVEDSIYVRSDCLGYGVGRKLLSGLIEHAEVQGFHSMVACICGVNPASVALHDALGFSIVGTLPEAGRKFGQWLDVSIMRRALIQPTDVT